MERGQIIVTAGIKGGVGKTTTAINLATWFAQQGADTCILDLDTQQSATKWIDRRNETREENTAINYISINNKTEHVKPLLIELSQRHDVVICDTAGRNSTTFREVALYADKILMPFQCSQFDLETLGTMIRAIADVNASRHTPIKARAFLNRVEAHEAQREYLEARKLLAEFSDYFELSSTKIGNYKAFRKSLTDGLSVLETKDQSAARAQIQLLAQEVAA